MNSQLTWNLVTLFGIHYSEVMMAKWKMSQVNTLCFLKKNCVSERQIKLIISLPTKKKKEPRSKVLSNSGKSP